MKDLKGKFPIFQNQPDLVYLDSGATTLKPKVVVDRVVEYYTGYTANIHRGLYKNAQRADEEYEKARVTISQILGVKSENEVVFVSGTTMGINLIAKTIGKAKVGKGDEVVITEMEHHSNLVPWQMICGEKGAKLKWLEVKNIQCPIFNIQEIEKIVTGKTKVFAITQVSNVAGTINDIKKITKTVKRISPDCLVVVDGAQSVPHMEVNVQDMGCDFLTFSGHKIYGPTGIGVLWGREELLNDMDVWMGGGDMIRRVSMEESTYKDAPGKFEAGTPHIAGVIGLAAAIKWLQKFEILNSKLQTNSESKMQNSKLKGMEAVREHEVGITEYALRKLDELQGVEIYGPKKAEERGGLVAFNVKGVHPHDVAQILSDRNICVRTGFHCAQPLHTKLGIPGSVRASFGVYTNREDIEKLIEGLSEVKRKFR